jgi:hypothetical protein
MTTTESYGCDKHGEDAYPGCAMCDLETLRERLHEAELVAASWKREAELNEQAANESSGYAKRLAKAEALLVEIAGHRQAVAFFAPQLAGVIAALDRIDAHLARKP